MLPRVKTCKNHINSYSGSSTKPAIQVYLLFPKWRLRSRPRSTMIGEAQGYRPRMRRSRSVAWACHYADEIAVHSARKSVFFLCIMLRIGHSMVLVSPMALSDFYCHRWEGASSTRVKVSCKVEQKHQSSRIWTASSRFNRALNSKVISDAYSEDDFGGELDEDVYSSSETKVSDDERDDVSADEYFGRFISEALKEEEMNKNPEGKKALSSPNSNDSSSSPDDGDVKRMMLQQQQQIDLLMKLVKEGRQQLQPQSDYPAINDIVETKETFSAPPFTSATSTKQTSKNVAPLKAMLFIDGTWLYYSLNTRNPKRDVIIGKFGLGWQNNYKVDW